MRREGVRVIFELVEEIRQTARFANFLQTIFGANDTNANKLQTTRFGKTEESSYLCNRFN